MPRTCSIGIGGCASLALLSAICLAQKPEPDRKLEDEVRGIRATLDRLVQLVESVERSDRAALVVQQLRLYEDRKRELEAQQDDLAATQRDLRKKAATLGESARAAESGAGPNGAPRSGGSPNTAYRSDVVERFAAATRLVDETAGRQRAVGREIAVLRSRIARLEKELEDILK